MVNKLMISVGMMIALAVGIDSSVAGPRRQDKYKDVQVTCDLHRTLIKGEKCVVTITLENPSNATYAASYILDSVTTGSTRGTMPVGIEIIDKEGKLVYSTPEPVPQVFFDGLATDENPKDRKGLPLRPGERVQASMDITEIVSKLPVGQYAVVPIVWVPSGRTIRSDNPITVTIVEKTPDTVVPKK